MTLADQAVPVYARDLRAFIEKLQLDEFVGVGWSMGAFVWVGLLLAVLASRGCAAS